MEYMAFYGQFNFGGLGTVLFVYLTFASDYGKCSKSTMLASYFWNKRPKFCSFARDCGRWE